MSNDFLWVEKYRPHKISDTILPDNLKEVFQNIVNGGELPNMLFSGTAGLGKTTVARALCDELDYDYIVVNGSEEGNIDTLRGKIKRFASSISLSGDLKVVILDEADYLNPQSTQPALRAFIEEFSNNCRFILTCNFKNRIIEPLHSRCGVYEFNCDKKTLVKLCGQMLERVKMILDNEGITDYDTKAIAELIMRFAPDWRRVLGELQRLSIGNQMSDLSQTAVSIDSFDDLFIALKDKNFKKMRSWIVNNIDIDATAIFRGIYDRMLDKVDGQSIPLLVTILAEYQYKHAFVADHELNTVACMTEIMGQIEMK